VRSIFGEVGLYPISGGRGTGGEKKKNYLDSLQSEKGPMHGGSDEVFS